MFVNDGGTLALSARLAVAPVLLVLVCAPTVRGQAPSITSVTNAALPGVDSGGLKPRSIATIFGSSLADSPVSTAPPWQTQLGGVEVHLVVLPWFTSGVETQCATTDLPCELVADLLYVSPTQINFLVPDVSVSAYAKGLTALQVRIVLIRDGVRFDSYDFGSLSAFASFFLNPSSDLAVFQAGWDCDFSLSPSEPQACGFSQSPGGQGYRVLIGAVTDASGSLITSQNPVHQGQPIVLWATGLGPLSTDGVTGLLEQKSPANVTFGVHAASVAGTGSLSTSSTPRG